MRFEITDGSFSEALENLGIAEGDNITIATLRAEHQGKPEAGGTPPAYLISINGATPVTEYTEYGCYLGGQKRIYTVGADQICRSYTGDALTFVLMQPSSKEQVVMSGYKTSYSVGSSFSASVKWTKNNATQLNNTYTMKVLKDVEGVGICLLTEQDVVRHVMVQRIIEAYAKFEEKRIGRGSGRNEDLRAGELRQARLRGLVGGRPGPRRVLSGLRADPQPHADRPV